VYLIPDFQENFGTKTLVFEDDEVHLFQQLIKEVYDKIMQHDFYEGCGKKTCQWCEFVKTQVLPDSVFNELVGELDE
jgi:DNA helicase-2/ATP-dependent DNA helicase PcrA